MNRENVEVVGHTDASSSCSAANNVALPEISALLRLLSCCWELLCQSVHISTRYSKRSAGSWNCCQGDCNWCQPTIVYFYSATFKQHLGSCTCCDLRCALTVQCCCFTMQYFVSLCLQRSLSIWMTSEGVKNLSPSGGVVLKSVVLFCTVCLFGFSRKHHGTNSHSTSCSTSIHQR